MSVKSGSAGGSGEGASATSSPFATKSPRAPGKVSAGLAARMKGINLDPSAGGGEVAAAGVCGEEQEPPPPPAGGFSGTGSSPRVSQGLAARMQVNVGLGLGDVWGAGGCDGLIGQYDGWWFAPKAKSGWILEASAHDEVKQGKEAQTLAFDIFGNNRSAFNTNIDYVAGAE